MFGAAPLTHAAVKQDETSGPTGRIRKRNDPNAIISVSLAPNRCAKGPRSRFYQMRMTAVHVMSFTATQSPPWRGRSRAGRPPSSGPPEFKTSKKTGIRTTQCDSWPLNNPPTMILPFRPGPGHQRLKPSYSSFLKIKTKDTSQPPH